jgi:hypothetical protein
MSFEPSVVRELDGSLLMSVRGYGRDGHINERWHNDVPETWDALRLYRSADGENWREAFCIYAQRAISPVILNVTADGRPYIAGNPLRRNNINRSGRTCKTAWMRDDLFFWPLNDARTGVLTPTNVLDARREFGCARADWNDSVNFWYLDHPAGGAFRLADGNWHGLVGFRVCEFAEVATSAPPTPHTGYWLEEVHADNPGTAAPRWLFD